MDNRRVCLFLAIPLLFSLLSLGPGEIKYKIKDGTNLDTQKGLTRIQRDYCLGLLLASKNIPNSTHTGKHKALLSKTKKRSIHKKEKSLSLSPSTTYLSTRIIPDYALQVPEKRILFE